MSKPFNPFGDLETAGYLRNFSALKDAKKVRRQEHLFFESNAPEALSYLQKRRGPITYRDFLKVHEILFEDFYPWAGKDRHQLQVAMYVGKGSVYFEEAHRCQMAVEWGLKLGNDRNDMRENPGKVMGQFAWGHSFLDGNGRTMLLVHSELCERAGFSIDWTRSAKPEYLEALTLELADPKKRSLDLYLKDFISESKPRSDWVASFMALPGLDGGSNVVSDASYDGDDEEAREQYEHRNRIRGGAP